MKLFLIVFVLALVFSCSKSSDNPGSVINLNDSNNIDSSLLDSIKDSLAIDSLDSGLINRDSSVVDSNILDSNVFDSNLNDTGSVDSTDIKEPFTPNIDYEYPANSPVAINGNLRIDGTNIVNKNGKKIQLRGMSSHGLQWYENYINSNVVDTLAAWGANVVRLAMYVTQDGYAEGTNAEKNVFKTTIDEFVKMIGQKGLYVIIDWHVLDDGNGAGDPWTYYKDASEFWDYMSKKHANKPHVLFEICNEPSPQGVVWSRTGDSNDIKDYAEAIIPLIRANDSSKSIIIVGTPSWSGSPSDVVKNKLEFENIAYAKHFYAGSHSVAGMETLADEIPIFVSEWGVSDYTGNGGDDYGNAAVWLDLLKKKNISWCNWSLCGKDESSAFLKAGAPAKGPYSKYLSLSGQFVKSRFQNPDSVFVPNVPYELNIDVESSGGSKVFVYPKKDVYNYGDTIMVYYELGASETFTGWYWYEGWDVKSSENDTLIMVLNESTFSTTISAYFKNRNNELTNGSFDTDLSYWYLNSPSDAKNLFRNKNDSTLVLELNSVDTIASKLATFIYDYDPDSSYTLSFKARSNEITKLGIEISSYDNNYTENKLFSDSVSLSSDFQTYTFPDIIIDNSYSEIYFNIKGTNGSLIMDDVVVKRQ